MNKNVSPANPKFSKIYTHNQQELAKRLSEGSYDLVCGYSWEFLSPFLEFCRMLGLSDLFSEVEAEGYQRQMFGSDKLLILYFFKQLLGIKYLNEVPDELFKDKGLMKLLGFGKKELEEGSNKRGKAAPLHKDSLGDGLSRIEVEEQEKLFNEVIKSLIRLGILSGKITAIVDGTNLETTERYEGCGKKTITHEKYDKKGKLVEIVEHIYGFKVIYLYDYQSRIPLAVKIVQIQEHENQFLLELINQAVENGVEIGKVLIDKGFIDGKNLWRIKNEYGIDFVIPSKSNMDVTELARNSRDDKKVKWQEREEDKKKKQQHLKLFGVSDLRIWSEYVNPENHLSKNSKKFLPDSLNAVVITEWKDIKFNAGNEPVLLTSLPVENPLEIDELYDLRSLIENTGNRELKQAWNLKNSPQKTENALKGHVFMTMIAFSICNSFRRLSGDSLKIGGRKFRRENQCQKVIIFSDYYYGIFTPQELVEVCIRGAPKFDFNILKLEHLEEI